MDKIIKEINGHIHEKDFNEVISEIQEAIAFDYTLNCQSGNHTFENKIKKMKIIIKVEEIGKK